MLCNSKLLLKPLSLKSWIKTSNLWHDPWELRAGKDRRSWEKMVAWELFWSFLPEKVKGFFPLTFREEYPEALEDGFVKQPRNYCVPGIQEIKISFRKIFPFTDASYIIIYKDEFSLWGGINHIFLDIFSLYENRYKSWIDSKHLHWPFAN